MVAILVGFIGALLALVCEALLVQLQIDDPVGAVSVHGPPGIWGTLAAALFAEPHCQSEVQGLLYGASQAGWDFLATQLLGVITLSAMSAGITYVAVLAIDVLIGFRCSRAAELLGLDFWEHHFDDGSVGRDNPMKRMASIRKNFQRAAPSSWCSCGHAEEEHTLDQAPTETPVKAVEEFEMSAKIQALEAKLERLSMALLEGGSVSLGEDVFGHDVTNSLRAARINAYVGKMHEATAS